MPGRSYEFVQVDVFTPTPLMGNPLAVFTDARGLNDGEMQALAREMNLSETTFILPRDPATEAREGKKVMQFLSDRRYIANVVDGKVQFYGRGGDRGLNGSERK